MKERGWEGRRGDEGRGERGKDGRREGREEGRGEGGEEGREKGRGGEKVRYVIGRVCIKASCIGQHRGCHHTSVSFFRNCALCLIFSRSSSWRMSFSTERRC